VASKDIPALRNYATAEDVLFSYLRIPLAVDARPCGRNTKASQECAKLVLHNWSDVSELNRPAILVMTTPEKFSSYLVLIGLDAENALVIDPQQQRHSLALSRIGRDWTGEIIYLWKRPPGFSETLLLGDSSATIAWVAQQFANLDHQKEPLTDDLFSLELQERIKIFQRTQNLHTDGAINERTLMRINELLGIDTTLLTHFQETQNHVPTP
jgi:general secretion pathway protein A